MQLGTRVRTKNRGEKASHLHGTYRKEHGILNLYSSPLSANIFETQWPHVSLKSFLVPRKHICTVLDSWSDNPANREHAGGLHGSRSFEELFGYRCNVRYKVFPTEKPR